MATLWRQPSMEFHVKVVRVAGVEARLEGSLFVRYYVPAGDGRRRIRVDTREVPCGAGGDDVLWGERASFQLAGNGGAVDAPGKVAFELRWRPRPSSSGLAAFLGSGRPSSRVLARAELALSASADSWLRLSPASRELGGGCKAPKLLVEVKVVHAVAAADRVAVQARKLGGVNECCRGGERCGSCGWVGTEEDMFLAATFTQ
ncbi:hypothetical protein D1007_52420 [Hordeum vulgare]|uniref:Predicted protein n=1 Tax=Hordeum vulgare subsp. vulgare TaxID=112509 RepID=F2DFF0_HORVV|nr:uncharacterized protein LOC123430362 [Hordeum vulgare subsp. vulgare]KAE8775100.1 hypothetical protein D1007_52420 [Hordeum vulgare]KAI5014907.1 hypothetical protein ZWY2020_056297 [Hordeum vulgare]BAJ93821.1 predicted protein [Hordeum vulgare subsp. vulgare]